MKRSYASAATSKPTARSLRRETPHMKGAGTPGVAEGDYACLDTSREGTAVARVTVVNDSPEFLDMIGDILEDERYPVTLIDGDVPEPLERIRESRPHLLMIDLRLGSDKLHGWDIVQQVRQDRELAPVPILLCSADVAAMTEIEQLVDDTRRTAMLTKPFRVEDLMETVERLLKEPARP